MQDGGSFDLIMKAGRIPVEMIAKITAAVSSPSPLCRDFVPHGVYFVERRCCRV